MSGRKVWYVARRHSRERWTVSQILIRLVSASTELVPLYVTTQPGCLKPKSCGCKGQQPAGYTLVWRQINTHGVVAHSRCTDNAVGCTCARPADGFGITDPDTGVGLLQAQTCNMRSKCRCSCVLQFTLCHAFSCVLHRPPSQLIHCIALCFGLSVYGGTDYAC